MSRNLPEFVNGCGAFVTPRERRVSRNSSLNLYAPDKSVTPRERRVSRNVLKYIYDHKLDRSRLARGV